MTQQDETQVASANGHALKRVCLVDVDDDVPQVDEQPEAPARSAVVDKPESTRQPFHARVRTMVRKAATHKHTRAVVRQGAHVVAGGHVVAKRSWEARSTARHQRMMQVAELKGDHQAALEWEQRAAQFRQQRHQRRMELAKMPYHLVKGTVLGGGLTFGGLLALGIMLAIVDKSVHEVFAPLMAVLHLIRFVWQVGELLWAPVALASPVALLTWLWANGRARGNVPAWLMPEGKRATDSEVITPALMVKALRDLGLSKLTKSIKEMADGAAGMLGQIRIAGCGTEVDVTLPSGTSTADIQRNRKRLAENLGRHEYELHITIPKAARTVRLWIADSGALDEPIGTSPLVIDETMRGNYKSGRAPWGVNLRGDAALISLFQRHLLITGLSNQGKTASLRALVLWLALDVTVELWLGDLKGIGDWRALRGIATVMIEGPTDEHACDVTEMLERGVSEMERRLMAPEGTKFHPLIIVVDEAQVAYMNPYVGPDKIPYGGQKATSRYFTAVRKLHNQGRAVDVLLWEGTQDPTDRNLPKLAREGAHIRASLVLGTESQSRMALGDAAVDGGAAPHGLRQGLDKGKLVLAAGDAMELPAGQTSITVRTYFVNDDEADAIGERAKALRARRGRTQGEPKPERDLLADVLEVLGAEERVRTSVVIQRLAALDPDAYEGLSGEALKAALTDLGAAPHKSNGNPTVSASKVRAAIEERELDAAETENGGSGA